MLCIFNVATLIYITIDALVPEFQDLHILAFVIVLTLFGTVIAMQLYNKLKYIDPLKHNEQEFSEFLKKKD